MINERIEFLRTREHRVGHAEFMSNKLNAIKDSLFSQGVDEDDKQSRSLAWMIRHKLLPLLLEYFPKTGGGPTLFWDGVHSFLLANHRTISPPFWRKGMWLTLQGLLLSTYPIFGIHYR